MSRTTIQRSPDTSGFICHSCGRAVAPPDSGSRQRNHCPYCLSSRHLDVLPGDRRSACRAPMAAVSIWIEPKGEWSIIHRCSRCGTLKSNRIAADDSELALLALALSGISRLPFPAARLRELLIGHPENSDSCAAGNRARKQYKEAMEKETERQ